MFTPTYEGKDYCAQDFIDNVKKFTYPNVRHMILDNSANPGYLDVLKRRVAGTNIEVLEVGRGKSSREAIARAQNYARKVALEEGYDYLFSLESDVFPKENIIERLLIHARKVVTGLYFIGTTDKKLCVPCATLLVHKPEIGMLGTRLVGITEDRKFDPDEIERFLRSGLVQVAAGGMGVCLMHRSVIEKIPFMYEPKMAGHSDIFWFNECHRKGIAVYVDTAAICDHRYSDWTKVKDR